MLARGQGEVRITAYPTVQAAVDALADGGSDHGSGD
jgi:hypothetical protein